MLTAGLTGGLATGKSFVGRALEELGCHLIRADELGHAALLPEGEAYAPVVREFGTGILSPSGAIDRRKLAAAVFGHPERLAALNALVHPAVFRREEALIAEAARRDPRGIAVVEAAILIEAGSHKKYDRLIVVVSSQEQQIARAMERDGATREEVLARLERQMPVEEKRKFADYVIDSSGTQEETLRQAREVYAALRSLTL